MVPDESSSLVEQVDATYGSSTNGDWVSNIVLVEEHYYPEARGENGEFELITVDPHYIIEQNIEEKSGLLRSFFNLLRVNLESGILAIPSGFLLCGLIAGPVIMLFVAFVSIYCCLLLDKARDKLRHKYFCDKYHTYGMISEYVGGTVLRGVVEFGLLVGQIGSVTSYVIFACANLVPVAKAVFGYNVPFYLFALALYPVLCALCWIRNMRSIAPISGVANGVFIMGLLAIMTYETWFVLGSGAWTWRATWINLPGIPLFIGVAVYCMATISTALPVENNMRDPAQFSWFFSATMYLVLLLLSVFGSFGYVAFGSDTQDVITLNLPATSIFYLLTASICLCLVLTYPAQIFPVIEICEKHVFFERAYAAKLNPMLLYWLQNAFRSFIVLTTVVAAVCIPNVGIILSLTGASTGPAIGYIIPVLIYFRLHWHQGIRWYILLFHVGIIIFALTVTLIGTTSALASALSIFYTSAHHEL